MANALYKPFKEALLGGSIDLTSATIKVVLVDDSGYTFANTHTGLDAITAGDRVATSAGLASKTIVDGVFDAADLTFSAVTGNTIGSFVVYLDTGTESTSTLIAYFDTDASSAAISLVPNGSDIVITWSASGLFTL